MKIVFFGTPNFAADILEDLIEKKIDVVAVVTQPDRAKGRSGKLSPSPVKQRALEINSALPVFTPEKASAEESAKILETFDADLFVVVAYGEIIKDNLLNMPKKGCINIHASILPKYRGAAPIQRAIMDGEKETGITIMYMAKKMDAGDIISISKVAIEENMTHGELEALLCTTGKQALLDVLKDFENNCVTRTAQKHELATFANKIKTEDAYLDWELPATELHNKIRGVSPKPAGWCMVSFLGKRKRLKVFASKVKLGERGSPGELIVRKADEIVIACGEDALQITQLQLEGKKKMTAEEFLRGIPLDSLLFMLN